jgi:putative transposase
VGGIPEALTRKREGDRVLTDERVLGHGDFVRVLLEQAEKKRPHLPLSERIQKMEQIISERCDTEGITTDALASGSRAGTIPKIRSDLATRLVHELGISYAEIARNLGISTARVSKIIADREMLQKLTTSLIRT